MFQIAITCLSLLFSALPAATVNLPPKITLSVPPESAVEGRDIPLYITIVHSPRDKIDESSFLLDDKPFKVTSIQKETVAPEAIYKGGEEDSIVVSRYRGMLPGRKPGIYTVGPISIIVNKIRYESGGISINVQGAVSSRVLRLEALPLSDSKIFPGQEVSLGYRIYFEKPIQLTREELPLISVKGFLNVGSPTITTEDTPEGGMQTIVQKARAQQPGTYSVPKSVIEGMEVEGTEEEKTLIPPLYRATVKEMELQVLPFPEKGSPAAFDGALGSFVWRTTPLDGTDVKVGQTIRIQYRVSGRGDLSTVKFPPFDQIVGLQDSFWTESLPPTGEEDDGVKNFILTLRPKRAGMIEVPGFFTFSFDTVSEKYLTASVPAIALKVEGTVEAPTPALQKEQEINAPFAPPYEITSAPEKSSEISFPIIIGVIFAFILVGIVEVLLHKRLQKKAPITSRKLFLEAIARRAKGYEGLKLLKDAFYRRLYEVGMTPKIEEAPDDLPDEGLAGEVKGYLKSIDEVLYRRDAAAESLASYFEEAIGLYQKLKQLQTLK